MYKFPEFSKVELDFYGKSSVTVKKIQINTRIFTGNEELFRFKNEIIN